MAHTNFITLCMVLTLTIFQSVSKAETSTSGNLLPNGSDGSINSATGFTLNNITDFTGCCNELEANGTGTISASGSLVDITTTTQSGNTHTTTTTSLDGGVTLNATTEVQNCEWQGSAFRCGQAGSNRDTFSTTVKILDEDENVLATVTQNRNDDAGYGNNTFTYTDTVTHTGEGARKWDWQWQGIDGNEPNSTNPLGPNLLGATLTATLLDINYTPISEETQDELDNVKDKIEDINTIIDELPPIEEIELKEITFLPQEIEIKEIKLEEFETQFEESFKEILVKENLLEEFETALIEENITEEEFFEEAAGVVMEELKEEFEETKFEETKTQEGEINATSTTTDEEIETTETVQGDETETETRPQDEDVSTKSTVASNEETERPEEEKDANEVVEDETDVSVENKSVTVDAKVSGITEKVARVIKKLEAKLKRVDDKLKATSYVLAVGLQSTQPDISSYTNKRMYEGNKLAYVPNSDFFDTINRIEQQQIYKDATLTAYTYNDPIAVQNRLLNEIDIKKQKLKAELSALRSSQ